MSISPRSYGHLTSLLATQLACWFFAENRVTLTAHTAFVDFIINTTPPTQDLADAHLCPSVLIPLNTQRGKSDPEGGGGGSTTTLARAGVLGSLERTQQTQASHTNPRGRLAVGPPSQPAGRGASPPMRLQPRLDLPQRLTRHCLPWGPDRKA